jgi:hypothetical protein
MADAKRLNALVQAKDTELKVRFWVSICTIDYAISPKRLHVVRTLSTMFGFIYCTEAGEEAACSNKGLRRRKAILVE